LNGTALNGTALTTSARKGSATRGAAGRQYRRAARQCEQISLAELFRYWQAAREGRRAVDLSRKASAGERRTSRRRVDDLLHRQHTGHR
jgi:hypothetical protein